jgi:predicted metal-dependent hydrolase
MIARMWRGWVRTEQANAYVAYIDRRRKLLDRWYREQLRAAVPGLIAKWEPMLGVTVPRWSIRRMKTKWGSCNRETGHLVQRGACEEAPRLPGVHRRPRNDPPP